MTARLPDKQQKATNTVIQQVELLGETLNEQEGRCPNY